MGLRFGRIGLLKTLSRVGWLGYWVGLGARLCDRYSVAGLVPRPGGCLRGGDCSGFREGNSAVEEMSEGGCVASGSRSVGGLYKALVVPRALAFASETVCASAGFAHKDAFFDVRGARRSAERDALWRAVSVHGVFCPSVPGQSDVP